MSIRNRRSSAYDQFAPDVTGGARAIAISLTDQATGPVASRQRMLRMYGKQDGEITLWGQEFAQSSRIPATSTRARPDFKDHGFGFALGLDGGDPETRLVRRRVHLLYRRHRRGSCRATAKTNTLWYMLTGYTDWRGRGLFLDSQVDVGYVQLKGKRFLEL